MPIYHFEIVNNVEVDNPIELLFKATEVLSELIVSLAAVGTLIFEIVKYIINYINKK